MIFGENSTFESVKNAQNLFWHFLEVKIYNFGHF